MSFYCLSVFYISRFIDIGICVNKYLSKFSVLNTTVISWYVVFSEKDSMLWTLNVLNIIYQKYMNHS